MGGNSSSPKDDDVTGKKISEPKAPVPIRSVRKLRAPPETKRHPKRKLCTDENENKEDGIELDPNLYGTPIEEVDPFIAQETFCAVSEKYRKHYVYRYSASKSCCMWGPMSPIRKFAIFVTTHRYFDGLIIGTILCNCITLAMSTNEFIPGGKQVRPYYDVETDILETIFISIFTIEMILKIVAKGFLFHKFAYLRSAWNIVDFVVVVIGLTLYTTEIPESEEGIQASSTIHTLRIVRVLRILKTVALLPGLKTMLNALVNSAIQLFEVMALNFFCLLVFSLFALEIYMGKLRHKCVLIKGGTADLKNLPVEMDPPWTQAKSYYDWINIPDNWAERNPAYPKEEPQPCGNDTGRTCPDGYTCLVVGDNPDNGWTSFDTISYSMLTTFQILTTDFWERPYELVLSSSGFVSMIFFIVVLFFGSFYLLNLMLAVVAMSYEIEVTKNVARSKTRNQWLYIKRKYSSFSFERPDRLNLRLLTSYRRESEEAKMERTRKATKFLESLESDNKAVYESIPNDVNNRPRSLGDAILGLIGRKMSIEDDVTKFESYGSGNEHGRGSVNSPPIEHPNANTASRENLHHPPEAPIATTSNEPGGDIAIQIDTSIRPKPNSDSEVSDTEKDEDVHYSISYAQKDSFKFPHSGPMKQHCRRSYRKLAIKLRKTLRPIVSHPSFEYIITVSIICNTVVLALEHHGQPNQLKVISEGANNFFMAIFTLECITKVLALQKDFFASYWNIFDLVIVIASYSDFVVTGQNLSVIRGLRLLRVFKLAQSWITMKVLINIIITTFDALGNLTFFLIIVIYCFSILGMETVGSQYTLEVFGVDANHFDTYPRWNFQNFGYAFMMVFRIICGEWTETMAECFIAHKPSGTEWKCLVFFIPTLVIGNFVVLNLFLALLLDSFNTEDLKAAKEKEMEASGRLESIKKVVVLLMLKNKDTSGKPPAAQPNVPPKNKDTADTISVVSHLAPGAVRLESCVEPESLARIRFKMAARKVMIKNRVAIAEKRIEEGIAARQAQLVNCRRCSSFGLVHEHTPTVSTESAIRVAGHCIPPRLMQLNCPLCEKIKDAEFPRWDKMRHGAVKIVGHPIFEWTILFFIFASSITLAFEDIYLEQNHSLKDILFILNSIFCLIFIIEMIIKWFALGFWDYFSNTWCLLDFFIVAVSVVTLYFDIHVHFLTGMPKKSYLTNLASLKALRTLRALRPLRAISRWEGMKIVVNALMYAIPLIFNVFLVSLLFWLVFSIMGVQLFKGKFFKCVNMDGKTLPAEVAPTKEICCSQSNSLQYSWVNTIPNFDNVLMGYLSLFQIATYEGWMELMDASVDAVDVDLQPTRENQPGVLAFFVVFILFGGFFTLNLVIGVMVDNFGMLKKKYEGNLLEILLTPSQRHYYTTMKKLGRQKPKKVIKRPTAKILIFFYDLTMSRQFEIAVFMAIFMNLLVLCIFESHNQPFHQGNLMNGVNAIFTSLYITEALIKILGLRHYYFTDISNVFDFVLVMASLADLIFVDTQFDFPVPPSMLRIIRIFRIGRVLRLIKAARGIRKLLSALYVSLPALVNIGALIALMTFIYAILGMASFSGAARQGSIDQVVNFDTFANSCVVLLRLMLAAGWNDVLDGLINVPVVCGPYRSSKCGLDSEPDCPSLGVAIAYFISYLVIIFLMIINMYTAIILENYVEANQEEEVGIIVDDLEMFYTRWSRYDPQATQFIGFEYLSEFLSGLDPPFCIPRPNVVAIVAFNLPICRGNKIHCLDILHALVKHVLGTIDDTEEFRKLQEQMERKFAKQFPTRKLLDIISSTRIWKIQQNAAIIIQRAWRNYYRRTHLASVTSFTDLTKEETIQVE